ncbi:MAG TPA: TrbG/VirB9 family P-type conjugative transfer protein [Thermoanaerobaculia bacterium]|nr:TrbG/VirB9 family P-type conjugative transfer protein [Thermoanaerobaculia bacterium]
MTHRSASSRFVRFALAFTLAAGFAAPGIATAAGAPASESTSPPPAADSGQATPSDSASTGTAGQDGVPGPPPPTSPAGPGGPGAAPAHEAAAGTAPAAGSAAPSPPAPSASPSTTAPAPGALPSPPPAVPGEPNGPAYPRNAVPPPPPDPESLARTYRTTGRALPIERGTESLFPFGHGRPVLRCAPLRACALELEPGEVVLATSLGDGERWLVQSAASGPGARTPLLVVKPTACDLATNLLVATDRRIYEIALDSPPCKGADAGEASYNPRLPYTGLVRFYYPDDLVRRWSEHEEAARREADRQAAGRTPLAPAARLARLNFDYAWDRGKKLPWNPVQVFDDGEHTYLVLPPASRQADLPLLFAVEAGGALALLNYRLDGQTLVADRIVERAALLAGSPGARGSRRLDIANRAFGRRAGS